MFKAIKELLTPQPKTIELEFAPGIYATAPADIHLRIPIASTRLNLEFAKEAGIKPLSCEEIRAQLTDDQIARSVLFDTPPQSGQAGNHWRIIGEDNENANTILQLCGEFGNYDITGVSRVTLPVKTPMFTGVSIQEFKDVNKGQLLTLNEVVERMNEYGVKHFAEIILFSNAQGLLQSSSGRLVYQHKEFLD